MRFESLAAFIDTAEEHGEVMRFEHADLDSEMGLLTEILAEKGGPLLMFDPIKGWPVGFRVASNVINTPRRFSMAMGLPLDLPPMQLLKCWRQRIHELIYIDPVTVPSGRVLDHVITGADVDLATLPAPQWHERDGGRYIGTGDIVIVRDPDTGWVNLGTYRCCVQGRSEASLWIIPAKHGRIIAEKYWQRGERCPVAVVLGADPITQFAASSAKPWGVSEYSYAGALHGSPVKVVETPMTGLPIPAGAEIVLDGYIPNPAEKSVAEGPFGEWPGYYAHQGQETVIQVEAILRANNPILYGAPPLRPIGLARGLPHIAVDVWDHLERSGITDIQGVWLFCNTLMIVISLKQRYAGHARQAMLAAAGYRAAASMYRYFVAVDEDIDASNLNEVLWAICTRVDPATSVEILRGTWTTGLDPRVSPLQKEIGDLTMGRLLIDACRPFHWRDQFPVTNRFTPGKREEVSRKWKGHFDRLGL